MFDSGVRTIPVFDAEIERGAGVTQVSFSPCGNRLFAGSRRGRFITCWDIRFNRSNEPLMRIPRICNTYQRITFDMFRHPVSDQLVLVTGSSNTSSIDCFDVDAGVPVMINPELKDFGNIVNGVSYESGTRTLALATGARVPTSTGAWWDQGSTDEEEGGYQTSTLQGSPNKSKLISLELLCT